TVDVAKVVGLVNPQDHCSGERIESGKQVGRFDLLEVPATNRFLYCLQQRIFPDALRADEHERVVDLASWSLHAVRQPFDDVVGIIWINPMDMIEPELGFAGVAKIDA